MTTETIDTGTEQVDIEVGADGSVHIFGHNSGVSKDFKNLKSAKRYALKNKRLMANDEVDDYILAL